MPLHLCRIFDFSHLHFVVFNMQVLYMFCYIYSQIFHFYWTIVKCWVSTHSLLTYRNTVYLVCLSCIVRLCWIHLLVLGGFFVWFFFCKFLGIFYIVQFSSVVSESLRPHELQHARPPCPSPTPKVHPNSCALSRWCHPAIPSSVIPFSSCPPIPPSIRVFSSESALHMRWPKYWSFSLSTSPSNEHPGLISFRMDWLDLFAVQEISI